MQTGTVETFGRGKPMPAKAAETRLRSEAWVPKKVCGTLQAGEQVYRITHNIGTCDVIVQTRIAGGIREGGVSVVDENTVQLTFGGVLNESLDVVIIG